MYRPSVLTLVALVVFVPAIAGANPPNYHATDPVGVITSSNSYVQTNPDGSTTTMVMMVITKPDGSSVIKTEPLQTSGARNSQGQLSKNFVNANQKMVPVYPSTPANTAALKIEDLIAQRGQPLSVAEGPKKAIYRWADLEVTVVAGVVTQSRARDIYAERANEAERSRAAAERQRMLQEQQARSAAESPPPVATISPAPNGYIPRAWPSKDEHIAEIRIEMEQCHRTIDLYFKEISKPFSQRGVSPAQRDLAEAKLVRLEQELGDLQK